MVKYYLAERYSHANQKMLTVNFFTYGNIALGMLHFETIIAHYTKNEVFH